MRQSYASGMAAKAKNRKAGKAQVPNPPKQPSPPDNPSTLRKLLDFVDQPLFHLPVGILGGLMGLFFYTLLLVVCGACILLAFHKAKVVVGRPWRVQIFAYSILFIVTTTMLYGVGLLIKQNIPHMPTAREIASEIKQIFQGNPPEPQDLGRKRAQIKDEMTKLAQSQAWDVLEKKLPSVEADPTLRDVGLYFRGMLYSNARPAPDPERYLSQVPQESDLFPEAQRVRLHNYALAPDDRLSKAILGSMDRANLRTPLYYTLRLASLPPMSHREVTDLYEDFVRRHQDLFDFIEMKHSIKGKVGVYLEFDRNTVFDIPGCVLLFLARQIQTAHHECLKERKRVVLDEYDKLTKNFGSDKLDKSLRRLSINNEIKNDIGYLRAKPLPVRCK